MCELKPYTITNHNYNKIIKSDWLSTVLTSALIGQYASCLSNWTVRAITRARMITDRIGLHSVLLPLLLVYVRLKSYPVQCEHNLTDRTLAKTQFKRLT